MKKILLFALGMICLFGAQQIQARTINLATEPAAEANRIYVSNGDVLTGTLSSPKNIIILSGATVTLNNVVINGVNEDQYVYAGIECSYGTEAKLILQGTNIISGNYQSYPAIYVSPNVTLTIEGDGTLIASSNGAAAAIGAAHSQAAGNIIINSGTIQATGGHKAAAIGGAENADCGDITINGGTIIAQGGSYAPGIGSGYGATCGDITILNEYSDLNLQASKGSYASYSVGKAQGGTCGTIRAMGQTFTNGITQSPFSLSAPLWDGNLATLNRDMEIRRNMTLYGTLNGNTQRYKISIVRNVTVTLDNVTITGKNLSACPWAGLNVLSDATLILKGENSVTGFYSDYPGIYVEYSSSRLLTISEHADGGSLYVSCSNIGGGGAGIGGGKDLDCGRIWILSGTIEAEGGRGAGIGSGQNANCSFVNIKGGTITAGGRFGAAAIGAGLNGSCDDVRITEDVTNVTATFTGTTSQYSIKANTVRIGCDQYGNGGTTYSTGITTNPFIYPEPECAMPTGVQVNNITTSSATLTFTPGSEDQTLWYVKCRPAGTVANIFARLVNQTTVNFTELDPGTEYEVQVYAECENNNSDPTEWFSFTTESDEPEPEPCPAVTDLQVTNVTSTSVTVTFTPGSEDQTEWWVDCHKPSSILDRIYAEWVSETSVTISDLEPNTDYEIYVKAKCGTETSNTKMRSFTTLEEGVEPEPCLPVTNVIVSDITSTSAAVSFTPGSEDQTEWLVYCFIPSVEQTFMENVTETSVTIPDLQPNTEYKVMIKAFCGSDDADWSAEVPFTTLEETGIEEIVESRESRVESRKILHEGHLYFLRDGKIYNAQGARVK